MREHAAIYNMGAIWPAERPTHHQKTRTTTTSHDEGALSQWSLYSFREALNSRQQQWRPRQFFFCPQLQFTTPKSRAACFQYPMMALLSCTIVF